MRQSVVGLFLFVAGCGFPIGTGSTKQLDGLAAHEYVRSYYAAPHIQLDMTVDPEPEYASSLDVPRDRLATWAETRSLAGTVWREDVRSHVKK